MDTRTYLPFIEQTLHYFNRPHEHAALQPVLCTAAWRGRDLPASDELAYQLSVDEIGEIVCAVADAMAQGRPTRKLAAADFPLPLLAPKIREWREALAEGDLLASYQTIASEPGMFLDMDLRPGDIQLLSNHTVLHARTEYEDYEDPAERRHLLRLWLTM